MKTCRDTITAWVNKVTSEISDIEIVYGINRELDYHVVLVSPSFMYNNNEEYMRLESVFNDEFYSMFPNEDIIITDDNSIISITEVIARKSSHSMEQKSTKEAYEFREFDWSYHRGGFLSGHTYALAA
jgi:hypothetical protein